MRANTYYSKKTKKNETMMVPDVGDYRTAWTKNMKHPITIVNGTVIDDQLFSDLKPEIQSIFKMWAWMTFEERQSFNPDQTSEDITNLFRKLFCVWISENQVKDVLHQLGYEAACINKEHWKFKIRTIHDPGNRVPDDARFLVDMLQNIERGE
jgi:hypothetical protein